MGFWGHFLSYTKVLYSSVESLIKVCGSLTAPFPFEKGIRQGCPLLGLLYSIAIEPLLATLRSNLKENSFPNPGTNNFCSVSAYADDISLFVTFNSGFNIIEETYSLFSRASAASLNQQKSQGLWVGSWTRRSDHPLGFRWDSEGLKFLGVHLGNTNNYNKQNWIDCKEKINKTFTKWKSLSFSLSYKGKIIIANQLASTKIYHCLAILNPPENILRELQEMMVDFVWSNKKHLLKKQVLFQRPDKGGLGLASLQARMLTYRFSFIQRFLSLNAHPAFSL